jgi:group II intron reverse transcriptase/maturase
MRDAATVLSIIRERGKRGLPLEDIYRQLYNPELYLYAYARLYSNDGAMTQGATHETVDAMSLKKIETIIDTVRHERYRWTPVKRIYIPKKSGKMRPLGIPSWSDKLLQEVIRLILEAYYEPQFSDLSHGFRPRRGCHTALTKVKETWSGTKWFLEGDITQCYDCIDHQVLLSLLREKLHDNRFLRLLDHLLQAGYLEDWRYHKTLSGTPQGSIVSPILSNIYLDKLDKYVETILIPRYTCGKQRRRNGPYFALMKKASKKRKKGELKEARKLTKQAQQLPTGDPNDPNYRRLYYIRYADDTLFGFAGPKEEIEEIKQCLSEFLRDTLKLELSQEKTLITHARTEAARFLGYDIVTQHKDQKRDRSQHRSLNGHIGLRLPNDVVEKKLALYMRDGKPISRPELLFNEDYTIMNQYQSEYRGLVQYYLLAQNVSWLWRLHWIMQTSLLKTLASKHKSSVRKLFRKYRTLTMTPHGPMKCLEVVIERDGKKPLVARFGGIPLRQQKKVILVDQDPRTRPIRRNELIKRLLVGKCELCQSTEDCEVHHIRKLADLKKRAGKEKPAWVQRMAAKRRKTLIVCRKCHEAIHAGKPTILQNRKKSLASRVS